MDAAHDLKFFKSYGATIGCNVTLPALNAEVNHCRRREKNYNP